MDYLRHHLAQGVERARPDLPASDQQALIEQMVNFIDKYHPPESLAMAAANAQADASSHKGRPEENSRRLDSETVAFIVGCRPNGKITEIIEHGLAGLRLALDMDFSAVVSPFHSRKAARFLRSIQPNYASYDCALSVLGRSGIIRLFCSGFAVGSEIVVIATEEPLATSVPKELSQLAKKKPAKLGPALSELATWKKNQKNASPAATDWPHAPDEAPSREIAAGHATPAGRHRLIELAVHDLRNPISGTLAACEYLVEDASHVLEPHQLLILYSIESSTRSALHLLEDLAEIPSIQLAKPQLELRATDLVAVINQAVSDVRRMADTMRVKVHVKVREQLPTVMGDAIRLGEALYGLLVNAIESSPTPGQIEIVVGGRSGDPTILLHRDYAMAGGLPAMQPAGQSGSRGRRRKLSDIHAALLLARARRILEAHGGALRVEMKGKRQSSWTIILSGAGGHVAVKR